MIDGDTNTLRPPTWTEGIAKQRQLQSSKGGLREIATYKYGDYK